MYIVLLLENRLLPVPDDIKIIQRYGLESVTTDGKDRLATGESAYLSGEPEAFVAWLGKHADVWFTTNQGFTWTVANIKPELIQGGQDGRSNGSDQ